jgi:site-specific recombinase XerD
MKSIYRVLFYIRKTRPNKDGLVTIAIRLTIDGEYIEFNPKLFVNPEIWNPIGRAEGKTKEARIVNDALDKIRFDLKNHYEGIYDKDGYVTPEKLRDAYLGIDIQKNTLLSMYDNLVEQKRCLVDKTIRSTTLSKYTATKRRIEDFLLHRYNKKDMTLREINYQFISDYEVYLKSVCGCGHNSSVKHLRYLKKVLTNALKNRYISADPFEEYKLGYKPVNKEYLLESEIKKLMAKKFSAKRLEEVRDVFLFQCMTGVAYIDAANLTAENIIEDGSGQKWIRLNRQKSAVQANIPLLDIPLAILKKYKNLPDGKLLPMHSNQKMMNI